MKFNDPGKSFAHSFRWFVGINLPYLHGWVKQNALQAYYQTGYQKQQVLEVVLGISFKTLSNYVNHRLGIRHASMAK